MITIERLPPAISPPLDLASVLKNESFSGLPSDFALGSYDTIILAFSGGKDSLACLLLIYTLLHQQNLLGRVDLEVWHHEVDGREGSHLMDWLCTPAYVRAVAKTLNLPVYFSWLEGGFEREMNRNDQPKTRTWFETPNGLKSSGGASNRKGTRLKFPQVSSDLSVRWCSAYLKIDVARMAISNQGRFKGRRTLVISGERAEESPARARYPTFEPHECHTAQRHVDRWRPVHHWLNEQVWQTIGQYRVNPHPAYRLGFGRCSCQFCIFSSDDQWATLWQLDKARVIALMRYEQQFRTTIHRRHSIAARIQRGIPYPDLNPQDIRAALSSTWDEPIILPSGQWMLPAGWCGENAGPT